MSKTEGDRNSEKPSLEELEDLHNEMHRTEIYVLIPTIYSSLMIGFLYELVCRRTIIRTAFMLLPAGLIFTIDSY